MLLKGKHAVRKCIYTYSTHVVHAWEGQHKQFGSVVCPAIIHDPCINVCVFVYACV